VKGAAVSAAARKVCHRFCPAKRYKVGRRVCEKGSVKAKGRCAQACGAAGGSQARHVCVCRSIQGWKKFFCHGRRVAGGTVWVEGHGEKRL